MPTDQPLPAPAVTTSRPRTLEDRLLKFIEGHNPHIWAVIACAALLVIWTR